MICLNFPLSILIIDHAHIAASRVLDGRIRSKANYVVGYALGRGAEINGHDEPDYACYVRHHMYGRFDASNTSSHQHITH